MISFSFSMLISAFISSRSNWELYNTQDFGGREVTGHGLSEACPDDPPSDWLSMPHGFSHLRGLYSLDHFRERQHYSTRSLNDDGGGGDDGWRHGMMMSSQFHLKAEIQMEIRRFIPPRDFGFITWENSTLHTILRQIRALIMWAMKTRCRWRWARLH